MKNVLKFYGAGKDALFSDNFDFASKKEAIQHAKDNNLCFIVEKTSTGRKKVLAWNYAVEVKNDLINRYRFDDDKRNILASSLEEYWLVLNKSTINEIIIPILGIDFEKIADIDL